MIADFAHKFGLVLKACNLSRGGVAKAVGIDKSVVSRWASGVQVPTDHNLTLLTEAVGRHRPGFARTDWELSSQAFAAHLGLGYGSQAGAPALVLPERPSIAVLPFTNMSDEPDQQYFTDGITEDIITELSRFRSLFVIARSSTFSYKGESPEIDQVGRELGVRYVLEGSVRKSSNRIRVTGQLIDTLSGNHIWAERYDRELEDVFAVQEEVTQAIVAAIAPQIETREQSRATRRRPTDLSAYELAVRAWSHVWEGNDKADRRLIDQSIREAKKALEIDSDSVLALQALALAHGFILLFQVAADREFALKEAIWAAGRAVELDGTDPRGYALRGLGVMLGGQLDRYLEALADARSAHEMNPNDTMVLRILGYLEAGVGNHDRAIEHGQQVLRLSPRQTRSHDTYNLLAVASFGAKQYAEGIRWASRALNDMPEMIQAHSTLASCLVGAGEIDKAKSVLATGQKLAPEYFKIRLRGTSAYARPEDRERQHTFLRIAAGLEKPSAAEGLR